MRTFDEVLDNDLITVVSADERAGRFEVRIGTLPTIVLIEISRRRTANGQFEYSASHAIQTPKQFAPYYTSLPYGATPPEALAKALDDFAIFYELGVRAGHRPSETWLVPRSSAP